MIFGFFMRVGVVLFSWSWKALWYFVTVEALRRTSIEANKVLPRYDGTPFLASASAR